MTGPSLDDRVVLRNPDGNLVFVPREQALVAMQRGGFSAATYQEEQAKLAQVAEDKAYEGALPTLEAGAAGFARGATLGLSDLALTKGAELFGNEAAGESARKHLEALKAHHEFASGAGNLLGFAAPLLLSGGLAAAPELAAEAGLAASAKFGARTGISALGLLPRAVGSAGKAAGEFAAEYGAGVLGKTAATYAAEGALLKGGEIISDETLSQHPELTAEHILPQLMEGALVGAGLGVAGGLGIKAARGFKNVVSSAVKKGAEIGSNAAETVMGAAQSAESLANEKLAGLGTRGEIANKAESEANRRTFKALQPLIKNERAVEKFAKGPEHLGKLMNEEIDQYGTKLNKDGTKAGVGSYTTKDLNELGENALHREASTIDSMMDELVQLPQELHPDPIDLATKINRAKSEIAKEWGNTSTGTKIREDIDEFLKEYGPKRFRLPDRELTADELRYENLFGRKIPREQLEQYHDVDNGFDARDMQRMRLQIDAKAYPKGKIEVSPYEQALRKIRGVVENEFDAYTAKVKGQEFTKAYNAAQERFQMAKIVSDVSDDALLRAQSNKSVSLTDTIALMSGSNPLEGLAKGVANKYARTYGNQISAEYLQKAAKALRVDQTAMDTNLTIRDAVKSFMGEERASQLNTGLDKAKAIGEEVKKKVKETSSNIAKGVEKSAGNVSSFASTTAVPTATIFQGKTQEEREKSYRDYVEKLKERTSNPDIQFQHMADKMGDLASILPQTAAHVVQKQAANDSYLASKIPQGHMDPYAILPTKTKPRVSDSEMSQFERRAAVAEKGAVVLAKEFEAGSVNPETVDATKVMYPASFDELKKQIMEAAANRKTDLTYRQKDQIHRVFGVTTDARNNPAVFQALQQNYQNKLARALGGSGKPSRKSVISRQMMTGIQSIEQGDQ